MITKYGDIISRQERIYIFKTFVSKDLLRKDQVFAELYSDMEEKKLHNLSAHGVKCEILSRLAFFQKAGMIKAFSKSAKREWD